MQKSVSEISDSNAEASVLATAIAHPTYVLQVDYLKPNYFYHVENGCIYWAITELIKSGVEEIDALNLTTMINSDKAVRKKIQEYNLNDMQEFINMSQYAARHTVEEFKLLVRTVVSLSFKREVVRVTNEINADCFNDNMDLSALNTIVNSRFSKLTEKYITSTEVELFGNKVGRLWKEICERRSADGFYGIPSKFDLFNQYFTYEPGELVLLKARMKQGKSAFFMNEALHKITSGVPTLYIDTEMTDRAFYERLLANMTGVSVNRIKSGRYSHEEALKIEETNAWLKDQPFVHIYMPSQNDDEIYATCKILKYKMNLQFFIFDYIKSNQCNAAENANLLGAKTDFLKNRIAGELSIAVLAGAQLNRANEVADSDKIERYVSTSILWRFKKSEEIHADGLDCGNIVANVSLNRNGEQMLEDEYIHLKFDGDRMRVEEAVQPKPKTPFDEDEKADVKEV